MNIAQLLFSATVAIAVTTLPTESLAQQPQRTRDDVQKQVDTLKKEDVAWRKIAWKTCLLDGLNESRKQGKPLVLWVFIDRPIDDERC
jgi:hypothetical protein